MTNPKKIPLEKVLEEIENLQESKEKLLSDLKEIQETIASTSHSINPKTNEITVELSNIDTVLITPAGKNFSLEDSRKNIQNCLDQMPNGKTLEGVPREVWLEWMSIKL